MRDSGPAGPSGRASVLAVFSWVLYDFSNTIFSISILSFFSPLWPDDEIGRGSEAVFNSASALLVFLTAPVLGRWPTSGSTGFRTSWSSPWSRSS